MSDLSVLLTPQFVRFLAAGGVAAAGNFGSRFLYSKVLSYEQAIVMAYLTGMVIAFLLMRGHVFDAKKGALLQQIGKFGAVNVLAVLQTLLISIVLARWVLPVIGLIQHAEAVAHLVGVLVPVVTSYFGHKLITFK